MTAAELTSGRRLEHAGFGADADTFASNLGRDISIIHSMANQKGFLGSKVCPAKMGRALGTSEFKALA